MRNANVALFFADLSQPNKFSSTSSLRSRYRCGHCHCWKFACFRFIRWKDPSGAPRLCLRGLSCTWSYERKCTLRWLCSKSRPARRIFLNQLVLCSTEVKWQQGKSNLTVAMPASITWSKSMNILEGKAQSSVGLIWPSLRIIVLFQVARIFSRQQREMSHLR